MIIFPRFQDLWNQLVARNGVSKAQALPKPRRGFQRWCDWNRCFQTACSHQWCSTSTSKEEAHDRAGKERWSRYNSFSGLFLLGCMQEVWKVTGFHCEINDFPFGVTLRAHVHAPENFIFSGLSHIRTPEAGITGFMNFVVGVMTTIAQHSYKSGSYEKDSNSVCIIDSVCCCTAVHNSVRPINLLLGFWPPPSLAGSSAWCCDWPDPVSWWLPGSLCLEYNVFYTEKSRRNTQGRFASAVVWTISRGRGLQETSFLMEVLRENNCSYPSAKTFSFLSFCSSAYFQIAQSVCMQTASLICSTLVTPVP